MSLAGSAPRFAGRMNRAGVPYGGIVLTAAVAVLGVVLNALVPAQAFEIVLNLASVGIISAWAMIMLCHLRLVSWSRQGRAERPGFRLPGAPFTGWLTLAFLVSVVVLMAFDSPIGTWTVASLLLLVPLLVLGWYRCRDRVHEIAAAHAAVARTAPAASAETGPPVR